MRSERYQFFFNLVFSFVSSDYKPLKGAHYRFEQDESLMKSATHSENAIKSILYHRFTM